MDSTDLMGRLLALEAENKRLWHALDELMRDQTDIERDQSKTLKRLAVIEAWLAAEEERSQ